VRIGPEEVSFSDIDSVKQIYSQQTAFLKAPIYETMSVPPLGIFSLRDKTEHSKRRRLLSHVFSQSNISQSESLVAKQVHRLVHEHVEVGLGKPLDMLLLFRLTAFDIVGMSF
jgi:benzoate 4-monooxygenase